MAIIVRLINSISNSINSINPASSSDATARFARNQSFLQSPINGADIYETSSPYIDEKVDEIHEDMFEEETQENKNLKINFFA